MFVHLLIVTRQQLSREQRKAAGKATSQLAIIEQLGSGRRGY